MRGVNCPKISIVGSEIVREGLQRLLSEQHYEATSWSFSQLGGMADAISTWKRPIIILTTLGSEACSAYCRRLRHDFANVKLIALCDDGGNLRIDLADAVLPSSSTLSDVTSTIDHIYNGHPEQILTSAQHFLNNGVTPKFTENMLSVREIEILCCLACGLSNKQIARELDITEATVKVHVKTVLRKLNLANRTQAAIWALQNGLHWTSADGAPTGGLAVHQLAAGPVH